MSLHPFVPADAEPESIIDLVDDCREVSGVLAPYVHSLHLDGVVLPGPRNAHLAESVEIDATVAAGLAGWSDYGA